jgi:hypothetical protein
MSDKPTHDAVHKDVLRVHTEELKDADRQKASVYVMPGIYVGIDPENSNKILRYSYTEVVKKVSEVLTLNPRPVIDSSTTIIVTPDHWDRRLPMRYARFAEQLDNLPFSVILHSNESSKASYKKKIPPINAVQMMNQDQALQELLKQDLVIVRKATDNNTSNIFYPDEDIPNELHSFSFPNVTTGVMPAENMTTMTRRKKKNKKKKGLSSSAWNYPTEQQYVEIMDRLGAIERKSLRRRHRRR